MLHEARAGPRRGPTSLQGLDVAPPFPPRRDPQSSRPGAATLRFGRIDRSVGRTFAPKPYPADSALSAPNDPIGRHVSPAARHTCKASASRCRPPCRFRQLYVSSDGTDRRPRHAASHQAFSPAAFPAACSRGCQPRVRLIMLHPLAARVKKPVGMFGSGLFTVKKEDAGFNYCH